MPVRVLRLFAVCAAAAALAVSAVACGASSSTSSSSASPSPTAAAGTKTITYSRVVDLQHVISPDIPLWPGDPKVVFKTVATMKEDGYYLRSFTIGEHSATHMNAPNSFIAGDTRSITSYEAEQLVVPAAVIDVREKCAADADYQLGKQDVLDWETQNGELPPGTFVIMFTGWQDKWGDAKAFFNEDAKGDLHFPGDGAVAAARRLGVAAQHPGVRAARRAGRSRPGQTRGAACPTRVRWCRRLRRAGRVPRCRRARRR